MILKEEEDGGWDSHMLRFLGDLAEKGLWGREIKTFISQRYMEKVGVEEKLIKYVI